MGSFLRCRLGVAGVVNRRRCAAGETVARRGAVSMLTVRVSVNHAAFVVEPPARSIGAGHCGLGDRRSRGPQRDRRSKTAIWVWARGRDRFDAEARHRLAEALGPVATGDTDPTTRAEAISALVTLGADGAADLALAAMRSPDAGVRRIVAAQLAPTGDRRVVDTLVALLNDSDGYVREAAAIGLETQGDPHALEPLRAMVGRERTDRAAKKSAKRAIRLLENQARGR